MCYAQEIGSAWRMARKSHTCSWCGELIEKTTRYFRWFGIVEGDAGESKLHPECEEASQQWPQEWGCWVLYEQPRGALPEDMP